MAGMTNASFKGRKTPTGPADDPNDQDGPGSKPDAEDTAEANNPLGYESHEQAMAAAHAHSKRQAGKVGMHH